MFAFRKRLFAYVEASYFTENWYRKVKFENAYSCDVRYVTQSKNYFKYEDMVRSLKTKVFLIEKRLNFFICQLILLGSAYCRHCFISKLKKCLQTVRYVTENGPIFWFLLVIAFDLLFSVRCLYSSKTFWSWFLTFFFFFFFKLKFIQKHFLLVKTFHGIGVFFQTFPPPKDNP